MAKGMEKAMMAVDPTTSLTIQDHMEKVFSKGLSDLQLVCLCQEALLGLLPLSLSRPTI